MYQRERYCFILCILILTNFSTIIFTTTRTQNNTSILR